jgi:CelD/BcsL family acetyltransferase involved in cellulose biosynthesis
MGVAVSGKTSLGVTVEVASSLEALQPLQPDYEHLQRISGNTLPFALHAWHVAWCRQFLNIHRHIDMQMLIHIVRHKGNCVAIVPLMRTHRFFGPVRITSIDLLGADPGVTEIRVPMVASGYERRAATAVYASIARSGEPHWVQWAGIPAEFGAALADQAPLRWQAPLTDYILDLPPSWEDLRSRLKRNIRESIRHGYNSLRREGRSCELHVVEKGAEMSAALERFLHLHALRASLGDTIKHPDVFASRAARCFLQELCEQLAPRGMMRIFELRVSSEVVASRLGFVIGKGLYMYYSGYDPAWSKYGVMTTTVVETIKYAIASGLTQVNLSPGTDVSKTRWAPRMIQYPQATQVSPSLISQMAWEMYRRARASDGQAPLLGLSRLIKRAWV